MISFSWPVPDANVSAHYDPDPSVFQRTMYHPLSPWGCYPEPNCFYTGGPQTVLRGPYVIWISYCNK